MLHEKVDQGVVRDVDPIEKRESHNLSAAGSTSAWAGVALQVNALTKAR